jgi:hypothetical protein
VDSLEVWFELRLAWISHGTDRAVRSRAFGVFPARFANVEFVGPVVGFGELVFGQAEVTPAASSGRPLEPREPFDDKDLIRPGALRWTILSMSTPVGPLLP